MILIASLYMSIKIIDRLYNNKFYSKLHFVAVLAGNICENICVVIIFLNRYMCKYICSNFSLFLESFLVKRTIFAAKLSKCYPVSQMDLAINHGHYDMIYKSNFEKLSDEQTCHHIDIPAAASTVNATVAL